MRRFTRYLLTRLYKPLLVRYLARERVYRRNGLRLRIHPDVFHPGFFFSTGILLRHLATIPVTNRRLLELGAGSGLLALSAAKRGAHVTATDINPAAVDYLRKNSAGNGMSIEVIESDLFMQLPAGHFDIILVNPPYYFGEAANDRQRAWYAGKNGEYFHGFFRSLSNYHTADTVMRMVLCEGDHVEKIMAIAAHYGYTLDCIRRESNLVERNYLYSIRARIQKPERI